MNNLAYYSRSFTHLRRAHNNGGAPHKPVLLLSIIYCIEHSFIKDERIYISPELVTVFKSMWSIWVRSNHNMNFALPFYHMSSEPFWKLIPNDGYVLELSSSRSIKSFQSLNTSIDYALIDKDLFYLLSDKDIRLILKQAIIEKYFPNIQPEIDASIQYLTEIEKSILSDTSVEYGQRVVDLKNRLSAENYEEEIFLRSNVFKRKIPLIYNNTCCITGLNISSIFNISMIDACHIVPFSETHDDTINNGIALCPNLHRAFDRGLITIDENYKVIISKDFIEASETTHSITQFENKKIQLPKEPQYYPKVENLRWHNENIFR